MGSYGDAGKIQLSLHTASSIQDSHGIFQVMMSLLTLGRMFTNHDTIGRFLHQSHSAEEDDEDTSTSTWNGSDVDTFWHTSSQDRELAPHRHRLEGVVDFITLLTVTIFIASMSNSHEAPSHRVRATRATRPPAQPGSTSTASEQPSSFQPLRRSSTWPGYTTSYPPSSRRRRRRSELSRLAGKGTRCLGGRHSDDTHSIATVARATISTVSSEPSARISSRHRQQRS